MQTGIGGAEVKGWSDAEVDQLLAQMDVSNDQLMQLLDLLLVCRILLVAILFIKCAQFAWHFIGPFFPTTRQMIGKA